MPSMTSATALLDLQAAQAGLRKARQALRDLRQADFSDRLTEKALKFGWASLTRSHQILAPIPLEAANEAVMTKQLAVQRYATALLVRLRRLARHDEAALTDWSHDETDELEADEED